MYDGPAGASVLDQVVEVKGNLERLKVQCNEEKSSNGEKVGCQTNDVVTDDLYRISSTSRGYSLTTLASLPDSTSEMLTTHLKHVLCDTGRRACDVETVDAGPRG